MTSKLFSTKINKYSCYSLFWVMNVIISKRAFDDWKLNLSDSNLSTNYVYRIVKIKTRNYGYAIDATVICERSGGAK